MENQGWYEFSHFRLDLEARLLFRENEVVSLTPKAIEILLVLIERQGQLVKYDELKSLVWKDSKFVEDKTLTQTIYTLRAALGDSSTEQKYIENVPKRGYRFAAEVVFRQGESKETPDAEETPRFFEPVKPLFRQILNRAAAKYLTLSILTLGILLFCIWVGVYISRRDSQNSTAPPAAATDSQDGSAFANKSAGRAEIRSPSDEEEIKKLVEESQIYESLTMYVSPNDFDEKKLTEYWLPEELGGKEIVKVKASLKRLRDKGLRYGSESKSERFEIRYVRVFSPRDYAEMGTIERWFLPMYRMDGSRVEGRNEYLGPYKVDYALRKIDGKWMIEETSTPRYEEKK